MATITKPGFLAAMALEPTLSRTPASAADEQKPRGRSRTRRRRTTQEMPAQERNPRNALDLSSGSGHDSGGQRHADETYHDTHATDAVRDFAMTELALSQRGISQMPTPQGTLTGPLGELSLTNAHLSVHQPGHDASPVGALLSRDRALLSADLGNNTDASFGMLAGLPTVLVNHQIDAGTNMGALFCTDGRYHVPGATFSQVVGPATLAGAVVLLGKVQTKAVILQIDEQKQQALVRRSLNQVAGVILNGNATLSFVGPAARLGVTYSKDVSLTSWMPYQRAEAERAKNGLFRSTFAALTRGNTFIAQQTTLGSAQMDGKPALNVGDKLSFNTLGSLVMGMGAAIFGAFAGSGVVASGEHAVSITRQSEEIYIVDVQSKLARMGNITLELPALAAIYATYGQGASTFNRLSLDTRHPAAALLLADLALGHELPFEMKERNWFWSRMPGSQAMAVDKEKLERYVRDPASMIYDFRGRSPLRGVEYLQSEISRLKPALSMGASISFFTYVLFNALGSFERVIDRDKRVSVAVSGNESRRTRELVYRSRKNVPGVKQESVEAKIADETIVRVISSDPSRVQQKEPTWRIEAKFNTSYHGKPELKRTFGWLADKLFVNAQAPVTDSLSEVSRRKKDTNLAVGFKKSLKLSDVFTLIDTSPLPDAKSYRDVMYAVRLSNKPQAQKDAELAELAERFMQELVIPQLHRDGAMLIKQLHLDTPASAQAPELVYEDEAIEKARHKMRKLAVMQSTPMVDKSAHQLKKTVELASGIAALNEGSKKRMMSLDREALGNLDTHALDVAEDAVAEMEASIYEAVRIEPRDAQTPRSTAIEEVASRMSAKQAEALKRLQTPPQSRRPSLSALAALDGPATPSGSQSATPRRLSTHAMPPSPMASLPLRNPEEA